MYNFQAITSPSLRGFRVAEPIGEYLRRLRKQKKLTLATVAERIGADSHTTVQRYETGSRNLPFDVALRFADALEVTRGQVVAAWVAANAGDQVLYEMHSDSIPMSEGFRELTPEQQEAVKRLVDTTVESLRQTREASGTIGHAPDRYIETKHGKAELVDLNKMVEDAENSEEGTAPGFIPRRRDSTKQGDASSDGTVDGGSSTPSESGR